MSRGTFRKMIKFVFFVIFSLHVSAFQVSQIADIEGQVFNLECDSDFNCYVSTVVGDGDDSNDYRFYKLDPNKTVVFQKNFTMIYEVVKNSKGNVYIFARDTTDGIWLLPSNSNKPQLIYNFIARGKYPGSYFPFIIDEEDNILFNTRKGIVMLKPDLNIAIAIGSLESCYFDVGEATVDHQGNIYFLRWCDSEGTVDSRVVVITSGEKRRPVPYAQVMYDLKEDLRANESVSYQLATDARDNVIFGLSFYDKLTLNSDRVDIKILKNGFVKLILSEYDVQLMYDTINVAKDRTFFVVNMPRIDDINSISYYLYFVDSDCKINKIDGSFYISDHHVTSNKDGDVFFIKDSTELMWIRNNETEVRQLFKTPVYGINWYYVDSLDVAWVQIYNYFYSIPLRSGNPVKHTAGVYVGSARLFQENLKTKEIYVGSERGLYVLNTQK